MFEIYRLIALASESAGLAALPQRPGLELLQMAPQLHIVADLGHHPLLVPPHVQLARLQHREQPLIFSFPHVVQSRRGGPLQPAPQRLHPRPPAVVLLVPPADDNRRLHVPDCLDHFAVAVGSLVLVLLDLEVAGLLPMLAQFLTDLFVGGHRLPVRLGGLLDLLQFLQVPGVVQVQGRPVPQLGAHQNYIPEVQIKVSLNCIQLRRQQHEQSAGHYQQAPCACPDKYSRYNQPAPEIYLLMPPSPSEAVFQLCYTQQAPPGQPIPVLTRKPSRSMQQCNKIDHCRLNRKIQLSYGMSNVITKGADWKQYYMRKILDCKKVASMREIQTNVDSVMTKLIINEGANPRAVTEQMEGLLQGGLPFFVDSMAVAGLRVPHEPKVRTQMSESIKKRTKLAPLANFLLKKTEIQIKKSSRARHKNRTKGISNRKDMRVKTQQMSSSSASTNNNFSKMQKSLFNTNPYFNSQDNPEQPIQQLVPVIKAFRRQQLQLRRPTEQSAEDHQGADVEICLLPKYAEKSAPRRQPQPKTILIRNPKTQQPKPFVPPFPTYYYRSLLWKVNYSNQLIIDTPAQYQHRLRVYVGKGNNGALIRGLIKRRIWFAVTDKIEQSNFVWTQIKHLPYFDLQRGKSNPSNIAGFLKESEVIDGTGILNKTERSEFDEYFKCNRKAQQKSDQKFQHRAKNFNNICTAQSKSLRTLKSVAQIKQQKMHNHLINNYIIGNKKALLKTMTQYYKSIDEYVFNYLPLTFHICEGVQDENYHKFLRYYELRRKQTQQNMWIVKPGESSNRGNGIKVCKNLQQIRSIVRNNQKHRDGEQKTFIIQSYIEKPLLYNKRKFDLRHYMLITSINGILKGYWYRQGYVRTTSQQFTLNVKAGSVHLTNDAVQKNLPGYGKYQKGNKISYEQLGAYIARYHGYKGYSFKDSILPKMKKITTDVMKACSGSISPQLHNNNFQVFGMDFMIDQDFNVWLIEVNTNPCLQLSCPLLANLIPRMVENTLELTLDALYPPPMRCAPKGTHYLRNLQEDNKFQLVYDSRVHGFFSQPEVVEDRALLYEEEEVYQDEGEEWSEDN